MLLENENMGGDPNAPRALLFATDGPDNQVIPLPHIIHQHLWILALHGEGGETRAQVGVHAGVEADTRDLGQLLFEVSGKALDSPLDSFLSDLGLEIHGLPESEEEGVGSLAQGLKPSGVVPSVPTRTSNSGPEAVLDLPPDIEDSGAAGCTEPLVGAGG